MTLLNRKIDYALLILCYLHRKNEGGCAREIADHYGISRPFVANILKDLCQKGFVASLRGVRGGYLLQPRVQETTLVELMDQLDDPVRLVECNHEQPETCCNVSEACPIREPLQEVHRHIRELLHSVKLVDLFREGAKTPVAIDLGVSRCALPDPCKL